MIIPMLFGGTPDRIKVVSRCEVRTDSVGFVIRWFEPVRSSVAGSGLAIVSVLRKRARLAGASAIRSQQFMFSRVHVLDCA